MFSPKLAPFKFANPALRYHIDLNLFELLEDYVSPELTVPKGYFTDGATVPRVFWNLVPPYHRYFPAAIVHDYQCSTGVDRYEAVELFKENLLRLKLSSRYVFALYYGVRVYLWWLKLKTEVKKCL